MTEQHLETLRDLNHNYVRSVDQADVGWFDRHLAPGFMNTNPDRTVSSIKRQMGTKYRVAIDAKEYSPEEISSTILQKLRVESRTQAVILASKIELNQWPQTAPLDG